MMVLLQGKTHLMSDDMLSCVSSVKEKDEQDIL